ncbi:helix-turn-helix transcriptional regulator [Nocardioides alkalitolerans]|uniref:helix-turn-helix transcriptional regulator n=1 Tax=Nocardioides alkalitolerans TaxID=281714 RepID=UPI0004172B66|nr:helix-turn-helix transcriptional regulator [Nocardioides alkalitolerans]
MSGRGQTGSAAGEVTVEEYGYGLGPPTGILVLRYPPADTIADFPEGRDDYVHQVLWSPDGVLAVRRGRTARFLGPDQALWVRRGVVFEARALDRQTVLRVCLRQASPELLAVGAGAVTVDPGAAAALLSIARPGVRQEDGLAARQVVLDGLSTRGVDEVDHQALGAGHAREVARGLLADPADATGLEEWAHRLHVSVKTLQRDFHREYGVSFSTWRGRTRLHASVAMLGRLSVTETAHRVGYASVSAYVTAFTRELGETPGQHALRQRLGVVADAG